MALKRYKRKSKGVPKGYKHIWGYKGVWNERKTRKGLWKFTFKATKGHKHKGIGSFGVGTTGAWKIKGVQYIKKISPNKYQTKLVGTKIPLKFNVVKPHRKHKKW